MNKPTTPGRTGRVLLPVWAVVLGGWLLWLLVLAPDAHLRERRAANWRVGTIPALRGRLLDRSGLPLAWSERRFDLIWQPADNVTDRQADFHALLACLNVDPQETWRLMQRSPEALVLCEDVDAGTFACLAPLVADNGRFRLRHRFIRRRAAGLEGLYGAIGEVRRFGQREAGTCGWEKRYDLELRGQDGKYRVLVDSRGRWVMSTWEEIRPPTPGRDVYVPYTVSPPATPATAMLE